jgi:hypothetical protein
LFTLALLLTACDGETDEVESGGSGESGETGLESCAPRPDYPEVFSSCSGAASCGVSGYACASQTGMDPVSSPAYCTNSCTMDSECTTFSECSAVSTCVGVCVLECADGKQCPDGMMCLPDVTNGVTSYYCF